MGWGDPWTAAGSRFALPAPLLRAVAQQESGMRPGAVSPRGATGLMQVMPATFAEVARKHGIPGAVTDPASNVMAGAGYLRDMLDKYQNPAIALAAYNAGPGRVDEWIAGGWDGSIDGIPFAETKNYVSKLLPTVTGLLASPTVDVAPRPDPKPLQPTPAAPPAPAPSRGATMPRDDQMGGLLDMADPTTEGLLGLGTTLLAGSGYSKTPVTLGQALGAAGEAGMAGYQKARQGNLQRLLQGAQLSKLFREQARQDKIDAMLTGEGGDGAGGLFEGLPPEVRRSLSLLPPDKIGPALVEIRKKMAFPDTGLTPIYGTDKDGNVVAYQTSTTGTAVPVRIPEGARLLPPTKTVDTGTGFVSVGPGGQTMGPVIGKDIVGRETQEAVGKAEGQQIVDAPKALRTADQSIAAVDAVLNDKALDSGTGWGSYLNFIPGSAGRAFQARVDQIKGQAFLSAFGELKGGGAITEVEGQKATQAIARLDTAQSAGDFRAALSDLKDVLKSARDRAAAKVPGTQQAAPSTGAPPTAAGGGGAQPRLRFNPQTGDLEPVP